MKERRTRVYKHVVNFEKGGDGNQSVKYRYTRKRHVSTLKLPHTSVLIIVQSSINSEICSMKNRIKRNKMSYFVL